MSAAHRARLAAVVLAITSLCWAGACGEATTEPGGSVAPTLEQLIVSDPSPGSPALHGVAASASAAEVVFVSLLPQTFAGATAANIRNRSGGAAIPLVVVDGGFDPVTVEASASDTLELSLLMPGESVPRNFSGVVVSARRPSVVRTTPARQKRDVPLNARIIIVFSEPMSRAGVTRGAIQLLRGALPVPGQVELAGNGMSAEFLPAAALVPLTEYSLVIGSGLTDLDGDPLEDTPVTTFTTVAAGPVALVTIRPESVSVAASESTVVIVTPSDLVGAPLRGRQPVWRSSDTAIALVQVRDDTMATVTGVAPGMALITATIEGRSGSAKVEVRASAPAIAAIVVTTVTTGADLDPDGYVVAFPPFISPPPVGINDSVVADRRQIWAQGNPRVWLADVDPNCTVAEDSQPVTPGPGATERLTFHVTCAPRASTLDTLAGVWRAERLEYFQDSALTSLIRVDLPGAISNGQLLVRRTGTAELRWQWLETYPGAGPTRPTVSAGVATFSGTVLTSAMERGSGWAYCDHPSCEGILQGRARYERLGDQLVITGLEPSGYHESSFLGWMRLTLRRIR